MTNLTYISPSFIVENLKASVAFYTDKLGFEVRFIGPDDHEPFWAIVGREQVSIFLKAISTDIKPVPNHTRHAWARWDVYVSAADPDVLFEEYRSKKLSFRQTIKNDDDGLRGFEIEDADSYVLFFGRPVSHKS